MKSLVIYFSRNGENYMEDGVRNIDKGNTEIVAETIKDLVKADLYKVTPIKEYPYNYQECCDVAKEEIENNIKVGIKGDVPNIEDYDVIYIGGPIWWGHYPCTLLGVLEKLDFNNKIILPFSTHEGSGLGGIMEDVLKCCTKADIREGLAIRGCGAKEAKDVLERWCLK